MATAAMTISKIARRMPPLPWMQAPRKRVYHARVRASARIERAAASSMTAWPISVWRMLRPVSTEARRWSWRDVTTLMTAPRLARRARSVAERYSTGDSRRLAAEQQASVLGACTYATRRSDNALREKSAGRASTRLTSGRASRARSAREPNKRLNAAGSRPSDTGRSLRMKPMNQMNLTNLMNLMNLMSRSFRSR
jgi:hypothetical protein